MGKFFYGIFCMLLFSCVTNYVFLTYEHDTKLQKIASYVQYQIVQGNYIINPVLGNCKDQIGQNGFGWTFNTADYFKCDKFQRFLNGNFKKISDGGSTIF